MATEQQFPQIKPSSRSYQPGNFPSTNFEALNGTKTHIRYGNKRVNATLTLGFSNILLSSLISDMIKHND